MPQPKYLLRVEVSFRAKGQKPLMFEATEIKVTATAVMIYDATGVLQAVFPLDIISGVLRTGLADLDKTLIIKE